MTLRLMVAVCFVCQAAALCVAPFPVAHYQATHQPLITRQPLNCATRRVCQPLTTRQPLSCAARRAAVSMATDTSTEDATAAFAAEAKRAAEAELTTPTIAELVEASFVRAVMDLRTGLVDTLKLFVSAVKAGYARGVPVPVLEDTLGTVARQTAGRPLMDEEAELRSAWISLVYLTLERKGVTSTSDANARVAPRVREVYETAVDSILLRREIGDVKFQDLKLYELLPSDAGNGKTAIERAILSQSMKVIWVTLEVPRKLSARNSLRNSSAQVGAQFAVTRAAYLYRFSSRRKRRASRLPEQNAVRDRSSRARLARRSGVPVAK